MLPAANAQQPCTESALSPLMDLHQRPFHKNPACVRTVEAGKRLTLPGSITQTRAHKHAHKNINTRTQTHAHRPGERLPHSARHHAVQACKPNQNIVWPLRIVSEPPESPCAPPATNQQEHLHSDSTRWSHHVQAGLCCGTIENRCMHTHFNKHAPFFSFPALPQEPRKS